jgi:sulfoxide reductase heme-binding subunit YedZ
MRVDAPIDWYAARAGGVVAYLLLTLVVVVGILLSAKIRFRRFPAFALEEVHRFGGLLAGAFVGVHVATIALDAYVPFSLRQLVVPFTSDFRPFWTAFGVVAAELMVALAVTNRLKPRLPYRLWRRAHYLNFALWGAATLHTLGGGTDGDTTWLVTLDAVCILAVVSALSFRLAPATTPAPDPRRAGRT